MNLIEHAGLLIVLHPTLSQITGQLTDLDESIQVIKFALKGEQVPLRKRQELEKTRAICEQKLEDLEKALLKEIRENHQLFVKSVKEDYLENPDQFVGFLEKWDASHLNRAAGLVTVFLLMASFEENPTTFLKLGEGAVKNRSLFNMVKTSNVFFQAVKSAVKEVKKER